MRRLREKIMCLFLSAVFCIGALGMNAYAADDKNMSDTMIFAIDALRYFGFIPDYYDYNTDISQYPSRADFVSTAAKIVNADKYDETAVYYYDVPKTHWAYNEICALTSMGILSGKGDKLFLPDEKIKKPEAVKILLDLMGYAKYSDLSGGYPGGYLKTAAQLDILEGVSSDEYLTMGDMLILVFNAMKTEILDLSETVKGSAKYETADGKTLLSVYHDAYYDKGIVNGANYSSVNETPLQKGEVEIDGVVMDSEIELEEYIGEKIEYFYFDTDSSDKKRVLLAKRTNTTDCLYVTVDNDAKFDSSAFELEYREGENRTKRITLDKSIVVIYNGGVVTSNLGDVFSKGRYSAKFVKDSNGKYTVAVVKAYENIVIGKIDKTKQVVWDKHDPSKALNLDKDKYSKLRIAAKGKAEISFSDLKENNVLSVYKSIDGEYMDIHVSTEQIEGKIETFSADDYEYVLDMGTASYRMPKTAGYEKFNAGNEVKIYLDTVGEIAYLELKSQAEYAAYMIKASIDDGEDKLYIKMLKQDGTVGVFETAQKIQIDGITYRSASDAHEDLYNVPTIALIKENSDGLINYIDTPTYNMSRENENSLTVNIPFGESRYYKNNGVMGALSVINDDTVIFGIPGDDEKDTAQNYDYSIMKRNKLYGDTGVIVETYKTKQRVGYEEYIVVKGYKAFSGYAPEVPILVDEINKCVNEDGDIVESVHGYKGSSEMTYLAESGFSFTEQGVQKGSLVRVSTNSRGEVNKLSIYYDYREKEKYPSSTDINGSYVAIIGYVTDIVDEVVKIGYNPGDIDRVMYTKDTPILIYDTTSSKGEITVGDINEAITYYNAGGECSSIVMITDSMYPRLCVIYK
ncbi:MAG: S-layer homology domain-containing protein [Clostridiales bacterium]|nr:S-layer homology domain-containing protein [Clostridiales bacterium]